MSVKVPALHAAILKKSKADVKKIIEKGENLDELDSDGRTALHLCIKENQPDFAKSLLKAKIKIDSVDKFGFTPFLSAAESGNLKILEMLLKAKASVSAVNPNGDTAVILLLNSPKWNKDALKIIKQILDEGFPDINRANKAGMTALYAACSRGNLDAASLLLKAKADPNFVNPAKGDTALFAAVADSNNALVKLLLENGASIHARNGSGQSIIDFSKTVNPAVHDTIKKFMATVPGGDRQIRQVAEEQIIIATKFEELPADMQGHMVSADVTPEKLNQHWDLYCNIVHFIQKKRIAANESEAQALREKAKANVQSQQLSTVQATDSGKVAGGSGRKDDDHHHRNHGHAQWDKEKLVPEKLFTQGNPKEIFKKLQTAGKGGFGMVFSANDPRDKSRVAIKRMPHISERDKKINYREVYFLQNVSHPNIVKMKAAYEVAPDHEVWVVMELLQGGTLDDAVSQEHSSFQEKHVAFATSAVLSALSYLHSHTIAHRDLKAANIMMSVEGEIKLIDFGLAVDLSTGPRTEMVGSPFWMPPEMVMKKSHSYPADIWSMAICVLEMANKAPPNSESALRSMFRVACPDFPLPGLNKPQSYTPEFTNFLSLCLVRDPSKRATADELIKHPFLLKAAKQSDMKALLQQIFMGNQLKENGFF